MRTLRTTRRLLNIIRQLSALSVLLATLYGLDGHLCSLLQRWKPPFCTNLSAKTAVAAIDPIVYLNSGLWLVLTVIGVPLLWRPLRGLGVLLIAFSILQAAQLFDHSLAERLLLERLQPLLPLAIGLASGSLLRYIGLKKRSLIALDLTISLIAGSLPFLIDPSLSQPLSLLLIGRLGLTLWASHGWLWLTLYTAVGSLLGSWQGLSSVLLGLLLTLRQFTQPSVR